MPEGMASEVHCSNGHPFHLDPTRKRWPRRCPTCTALLLCAVEGGCSTPVYARGLCSLHLARLRAHGDARVSLLVRGDVHARFMSYCEIDPVTQCWMWTGGLDEKGYGVFHDETQRQHRAHRWAWIQKNGPVPGNLGLDHFQCERPQCANPDHVRPATQRENVLRGRGLAAWNLAKTHCKHGHPFDAANTYVDKRGCRSCRTCMRDSLRRTRARKRAAS